MDWDFSIERNRAMLLPHIVGLFAMIGLTEGGMVERVSRPVYRKALTILRSAESAVRRLIIVMARNIKVEPRPKRPMPKGLLRSRKGRFQGKGQAMAKANAKRKNPASPPSTCSTRKGAPISARSAAAGARAAEVEPRVHVIHPSNPQIPWFLRGQSAPAATARSAAG